MLGAKWLFSFVLSILLFRGSCFLVQPIRQLARGPTFRIGVDQSYGLLRDISGVVHVSSAETAEKDHAPSTQKSKRKRRPKNKPRRSSSKAKSDSTKAQTWRIFGVEVPPASLVSRGSSDMSDDLPVEKQFVNDAVVDALLQRLKVNEQDKTTGDAQLRLSQAGISDLRVVRRSVDARHKQRGDGGMGPRFVYVLDVDIPPASSFRGKHQPGRMERLSPSKDSSSTGTTQENSSSDDGMNKPRRKVVIVGAGPAGLFCALQLVRAGIKPILLERGQPVESRGKDIGALIHRRSLNSESNFAFGEGGAGTWSDGKLTTRIGRNSGAVRHILETFVEYGAPANILVEGAPHLGTDNLVRLLRNMRQDLRHLGGEIHFGTKVTKLFVENGETKGVEYETAQAIERHVGEAIQSTKGGESGRIMGDAVVLATGHSARDVYEQLHESGVKLEAKGFAVGFRVEHPQKIITKIQYGQEWGPSVVTGKKTTDEANIQFFTSPDGDTQQHEGKLPVPSYRLATDQAFDGEEKRGAYSFCMCPGGQIVPASTDPNEVCVNGMSFSRRDSLWANSALVVTVSPEDSILDPYRKEHGVLAGLAFQRDMERRASALGGGNLTVPVQRVPDFIAGRPSTSAPSSSYRLGVKPAACHEIYPAPLVASLRDALINQFEKRMPGYICDDALLHAVETRTSSPVRVARDDSLQAIGTSGLFPAGEGAGKDTSPCIASLFLADIHPFECSSFSFLNDRLCWWNRICCRRWPRSSRSSHRNSFGVD